MPSNFTPNYHLNQWEAGDRVHHSDFNADNAKIDAALAEKADASALEALDTGKADAAELKTLWRRVTSLEADTPQISYGSYTGNGRSGYSNARTLSFTSLPYLLFVRREDAGYDGLILVRGVTECSCNMGSSGTGMMARVTWDSAKKQVSWYGDSTRAHMNEDGKTYHYVAVL